ncbi:predicted protein [Chaetomium globosum CBS 148.51]|uniref:Uncharacterized protein n=1 Tax=Chaetomium globosum (strain ATCC 6205 / CBS 148.51 / DSM 1962 / NBRC 6347 / NRRL 1970) TaxID=306901 RepID=Q2GSK9_CHAGB|nr:uncharacterized protein CHGG_09045 [Chaetomium globosum CBS 148.51]EAQ85031.1 predicted protein [Chaetomium globosum CBS 148.51]
MAAPGTGPAMVYQPLGSAALGHGSDDEDNERRWMVKSDLITVLRILVTLLAFADIVTWLSLGLASGTLVVAFIALFLVVGWNLTLVLPRSSFTRSLPAVVCQIGDCVCGFGGDHNQDDRPRKPKSRKQRRAKLIFIALVDLALGLIIVIFMWALELVLAILSLVACFWTLGLELGAVLRSIDEPEKYTRIQLAPDTEDRKTAGRTVSVSA